MFLQKNTLSEHENIKAQKLISKGAGIRTGLNFNYDTKNEMEYIHIQHKNIAHAMDVMTHLKESLIKPMSLQQLMQGKKYTSKIVKITE